MRETYLDCDDAWLFALTREKRRESRARRLEEHQSLRFAVVEQPDLLAAVDTAVEKVVRREGAYKRWRVRQWKAGNRRCYYCKDRMVVQSMVIRFNHPKLATVDHKHPLGLNGADEPRNWCMCCATCNNKKGLMTEAEFRALLARERAAA